jgi:lysophospholipase
MQVVDRLFDHPESPIPPGAACGVIAAADGVRLRHATFRCGRPHVLGTVLLLQGRGEFVERWFETIRDLQARGFDVVAFDWRGQGGSQRVAGDPRKGHVSDFRRYGRDLDAIVAQVMPDLPKPWFILAHSTGGLVAIEAEKRLRDHFARAVFAAPFLGLGDYGLPVATIRVLVRLLHGLGFGRAWIPGGGATAIHTKPGSMARLTSDPHRHALNADLAWRHPSVVVGSATIGWVAAAFAAFDRAFAEPALAGWRLPTLLVAAGADRVVSNRAIERFSASTRFTDHLVIPGARHELLFERDRYREPFWAAFDAFVPGGPRSIAATHAEPAAEASEAPEAPPAVAAAATAAVVASGGGEKA